MEKKYKLTKKLYSRKWRKENPGKVTAQNRATVDKRVARNRARRLLKSSGVKIKGKDVHHVNGNATDNRKSNLKVVKRFHEGGKVGNQNARKTTKKKSSKKTR